MKPRGQHFETHRDQGSGTFSKDGRAARNAFPPAADRARRTAGPVDRFFAKKLLEFLGCPSIRIVLWDGAGLGPDIAEPLATLYFHDRASLYLTILRPELHWGDLYSQGRVDVVGDLVELLDAVYRGLRGQANRSVLDWLNRFLSNKQIRNTFGRAADNIHHHYDIGNDFYRLWLDREAMQYTCAYYPDPVMTLEEAQLAKMDHVCRKLQLKPGDVVVEAGCGWGGFALHMARHFGVSVRAYNISREQVAYARDKAQAEGLADRVEYVLDDYRNIRGEYDAFVSIGMLEHVGPADFPVLGRLIDGCLKPGGRGLIHSIGRNRPRPMNAWIERRIFPGAYPPSLGEMMGIFETSRLSVLDVENLRLHYAMTLGEWLERFERNVQKVEDMMDERFVRAWRLYLSGSKAAFTSGQLQLFQVVFARESDNRVPWSRAHQYPSPAVRAGRHPVAGDD